MDVTPPQARLTAPASGATVRGVVEIRGAAYSRDDFKVYRVLIGENAPSASLHLLRRSPVPMQADVLAYWSTLGLKEGAAYRIVLEAEDINGNVATAQVVVTVDNQAPAIPVGLTANVLGADVNLSWRASRETDLLGYVVYRQRQPLPSGAVTGDLRSIAIAAAAYTDQGVTDGTRDYAVAAVDQAGNVSALSAPVTVHVDTRAPHAVITQPRDGATFDASVYLLATVADQDVQHVQFAYKTALTSIWNPLDRADHAAPYEAFFDAAALGLDYGVYELTALATDAANQTDSAPSTIRVTYTDLTGPEPVEGVTVSVDGDAAHVRWVANREADLAGYHIERRTGDGAFSRLTDEPLTQLHYVDRELADAAYDYAVIAVDAYGNISAAARVGPATVYTPRLEQPHTPTMALSTLLSGQGITTATVAGEVQSDHGSQAIQQVNTDADGRFTIADLPLERGANHITVRMTDADRNVSKPASVTVVSAAAPSAPSGLALSAEGMAVDLDWNANPEPNIAGYRLWRHGAPVHTTQLLTGLTAHASDNTLYANRVLDGRDWTYWSPNTVAGAWLTLSWPEARLVNEVIVQWYSADFQADDFEIEAWIEQQWVRVAAIRENAAAQHRISLPQPYFTTQIRLVLRRADGAFRPRVDAFSVAAIPLITDTAYREMVSDGRYTYTVTAVNTYGFESAPSAPRTADVGDVSAPPPVQLSAVAINTDAHLSWTASAASDVQRYEIERDGVRIDSAIDLDRRQYVDAKRPNGAYGYTVRPVDQAGNRGEASNQARVVISVEPPAAPTHVAVAPIETGRALALSWSMAAGAQAKAFQVRRSTTSGGPYAAVAETDDQSWIDKGLSDGVTYYYVVVALDDAGNSSQPSREASGVPQDQRAPPAPILHYPTLAGDVFETAAPQTTIIGMAEPGARIRLWVNGRPVAETQARPTLAHLDAALDAADDTALSPDGRYVALVVADVGASGALLRLYDLEAQMTIDVTPVAQTDQLRWTGDGRILFFNDWDAYTGVGVIRQYDLASDRVTTLTEATETDIEAMEISSDGRQLIVLGSVRGHDGLWRRALASEAYVSLHRDTAGIDRASLRGSPDGDAVAYWRNGAYEILDVGSGYIRYLEDAAVPGSLRWSPRGLFLVYVAANPMHQVRVYDLATETSRDLAAGLAPQWSADGRSIWYVDIARAAVVRHDLESGADTRFVLGAELTPQTLETVPSGFIGVLSRTEAAVTYHRLAPDGRFVVHPLRLIPGDNIVAATALDAAGNASPSSENLVVTHRVGEQADLAVATTGLVILPAAPRAGELARVSVTIENRGDRDADTSALSLVTIDPEGAVWTLFDDFPIPPLAAGASVTHGADWTVGALAGVYTLVAIIDADNAISERSEVNNIALQELLVSEAMGLAAAVSTDASTYKADETVSVTVRLNNSGAPWAGQLEIAIEDANGFPVSLLRREPIAALAYGEQIISDANWHTGSTFAGTYHAVVRAIDATGVTAASAGAPFRIVEQAFLTASVSAERLVYGANDSVRVTGSADYDSGNQLLTELETRLRILNHHGDVMAERYAAWGDLLPGASATAALDWHTGAYSVGTYHLVFEVMQDGAVLTQADGAFSIAPSDLEVSGKLVLSSTRLEPRGSQTVTYTVTNHGNAALRKLPIIVSLMEPRSWTTLYEQRAQADIGSVRQYTATASFTTETLALQRYVMLLQVEGTESGGAQRRITLATQYFDLIDHTAPLVTVDSPAPGSITTAQALASIIARDRHSTIARVDVRIDAGPWMPAMAQHNNSAMYRIALPYLAEGLHTLTARAIDAFGNEGTSPSAPFTVDRTPPQVVVTGVMADRTYSSAVRPVVEVRDAHLASTSMRLDGQLFVPGSAVHAEGGHQLAISAADAAGNRTEVTVSFSIDAAAPVITIEGVAANGSYNRAVTPRITVAGARKTQAVITLNGAPFQSGAAIEAEGDYELVAQAVDDAGHRTRKALLFLIDRTAPIITLRGVEAERVYKADVVPWIDIRDDNPTVSSHTLNGQPFTPGERLTAEGDYTLRAQAADIAGNVARQSFAFTIDKMAPVIDIQGVQADTVYRGAPYTYQVAAVDSADDALRYELLTAPSGMSIDAVTGLVTWMPSAPGAYRVTVQVMDAHQAAATQTYVLIVADPRDAPAITSTPITGAASGQTYRYQVEAVDPNGEPLTFRLEVAPHGMSIDAATGLITWRPQTHGGSEVAIHVENQSGASATQRYTLQTTTQVGEARR